MEEFRALFPDIQECHLSNIPPLFINLVTNSVKQLISQENVQTYNRAKVELMSSLRSEIKMDIEIEERARIKEELEREHKFDANENVLECGDITASPDIKFILDVANSQIEFLKKRNKLLEDELVCSKSINRSILIEYCNKLKALNEKIELWKQNKKKEKKESDSEIKVSIGEMVGETWENEIEDSNTIFKNRKNQSLEEYYISSEDVNLIFDKIHLLEIKLQECYDENIKYKDLVNHYKGEIYSVENKLEDQMKEFIYLLGILDERISKDSIISRFVKFLYKNNLAYAKQIKYLLLNQNKITFLNESRKKRKLVYGHIITNGDTILEKVIYDNVRISGDNDIKFDDNMECLKEKCIKLKENLIQMEQTNLKLKKKCEKLITEEIEKDKKIKQYEEDNEKIVKQNEELVKSNELLSNSTDLLLKSDNENKRLKKRIEEVSHLCEKLQSDIQYKTNILDNYIQTTPSVKEIMELNQRVGELNLELEKKEKILADVSKLNEILKEETKNSNNLLIKIQNDKKETEDKLRLEHMTKESEISKLNKKIQSLESKLSDNENTLIKLTKYKDMLEVENKKMKGEIEKYKEENKETKEALDGLAWNNSNPIISLLKKRNFLLEKEINMFKSQTDTDAITNEPYNTIDLKTQVVNSTGSTNNEANIHSDSSISQENMIPDDIITYKEEISTLKAQLHEKEETINKLNKLLVTYRKLKNKFVQKIEN
ncbi:hypothetical protein TCON_1510 [Astathelohania contejeani]|uniref:Uncharacterized protein n=1 Tax=Astathelohania contejeani TaxID=164912 RepID=A0ABQ7HYL3_9MICR|nr:hypothetical protein TCON_1510 [Thelohania contejeani]